MSSDTPSGPGIRFARRPRIAAEFPELYRVDRDLATLLDGWLRRTHTSRDAFGEPACHSATYVSKVLSAEVPMQLRSIVMLARPHAIDLLHEVETYVRDGRLLRRTG